MLEGFSGNGGSFAAKVPGLTSYEFSIRRKCGRIRNMINIPVAIIKHQHVMNHMLSSDNLPPGDLIHLFQTQTIFLQNIRNPFRHGNVEGLAQSLDLSPAKFSTLHWHMGCISTFTRPYSKANTIVDDEGRPLA